MARCTLQLLLVPVEVLWIVRSREIYWSEAEDDNSGNYLYLLAVFGLEMPSVRLHSCEVANCCGGHSWCRLKHFFENYSSAHSCPSWNDFFGGFKSLLEYISDSKWNNWRLWIGPPGNSENAVTSLYFTPILPVAVRVLSIGTTLSLLLLCIFLHRERPARCSSFRVGQVRGAGGVHGNYCIYRWTI